jgi:hypothetical protein
MSLWELPSLRLSNKNRDVNFSFERRPFLLKEKSYPASFATQSEAEKFPQRHRDWVSRLTEGTPRPLTKVAG